MAMEGVLANARGVLETAEQQRVQGLDEVAEERAKALDDFAKECATGLAEVDARRAELHIELEAM
jgi:hypothetical protein